MFNMTGPVGKYRIDLYYKDHEKWLLGRSFNATEEAALKVYHKRRAIKKAEGIRLVRCEERVIEARGSSDIPGLVAGAIL